VGAFDAMLCGSVSGSSAGSYGFSDGVGVLVSLMFPTVQRSATARISKGAVALPALKMRAVFTRSIVGGIAVKKPR
jgi:hypothetical protein